MGLDNGFSMRNKKTGVIIDLFHFRKYYELAEFFRKYPMLPRLDGKPEDSYTYAVTEDILNKLQHELESIYSALIKLPANTVRYYDENGYPVRYSKLFFGLDFDPTSSQSMFAGEKLIRLYQRVDALKETLEQMQYIYREDEEVHNTEWEIIFYDSY
jgi:hypothetical protein